MNISGVLITTDPMKTATVAESVKAMTGVEIHSDLGDGRLVAVIERKTTGDEVKVVKEINAIDGVAAVMMAYHYFEDETGGTGETMDSDAHGACSGSIPARNET